MTETLRYAPLLEQIIDRCRLAHLHPALTRPLLLVLLYDLLFGPNKAIEGGGHLKRLLLSHRSPIQSALARLYIAQGASTPLGLLPPALRPRPPHPRYVRVNGLLTSTSVAISALQAQGFTFVPHPPHPSPLSFYPDPHVPSLLVFPPSTSFHSNPLYAASHLILQDKASTFPPLLLNPSPFDVVVDACAAPGNKTSQLMAMRTEKRGTGGGEGGGVDAFEVDFKRFGLLVEMLKKKGGEVRVECREGCHQQVEEEQGRGKRRRTGGEAVDAVGERRRSGAAVTVHHSSFLSLDGTKGLGARVTSLLLDPTCSGSGMMHSIDAYYQQRSREEDKEQRTAQRKQRKKLTQQGQRSPRPHPHAQRKRPWEEGKEEREEGMAEEEVAAAELENQPTLHPHLTELADFQVSLLLHAFTLPSLLHLVYSTCSVHVEEDEAVIGRALADRGRALGWTVEGGHLPSWPRRGLPTAALSSEESSRMIRCDPDEDHMNGFFVCALRKSTAESGGDSDSSPALGEGEEVKEQLTAVVHAEGGQPSKKKKKRKRKKKRKVVHSSAVVEVGQ